MSNLDVALHLNELANVTSQIGTDARRALDIIERLQRAFPEDEVVASAIDDFLKRTLPKAA